MNTITQKDFGQMLHYIGDNLPNKDRDRALLTLFWESGIRVAEACNLKIDDCIDDGWIRITAKGGNIRTTPISRLLSAQLRELHSQSSSLNPHIFKNRYGGKISTKTARKIIAKIGVIAGFNKLITPHFIRHSVATMLYKSSKDIVFVKDFLGHSDISTTTIYLKLDQEHIRENYQMHHPHAERPTAKFN